MKCNECNCCYKANSHGTSKYVCKRHVFSKIYMRPMYAYMDVHPDDECHYGGNVDYEKSDKQTSGASCGVQEGADTCEQTTGKSRKVS